MQIDKERMAALNGQIAILKKLASDKLGPGYWGLKIETDRRLTHDEIVFLFAKIHNKILDFESILCIRQEYPDCTALKDGQEKYIEFEPKSSSFNHDDLSKCDYIICWEDDLEKHSPLKKRIKENNIEIFELKSFWQKTKVKRLSRAYEYTRRDIERMTKNKLTILKAYITEDEDLLTKDQLSKTTGIKGKALGGSIQGFLIRRQRDWLIKYTPWGYKFNKKYRALVKEVLSDFDMI